MAEYIALKEGQKYADPNADIIANPETVADVGYKLTANDLVIDIDCLSKEAIQDFIKRFDITTEYRLTDRGIHIYYKRPKQSVKANGICGLAIPIEYKSISNTSNVVIKRKGIERPQFNAGVRETVPDFMLPHKKFVSYLGYGDSDGRNNALYQHRMSLNGIEETTDIMMFINKYVFDEPLPDHEVQTLARDLKVEAHKDGEYDIATHLMKEYRMVKYQGRVYFYYGKEYLADSDILKRLVFDTVGAQKTRYVEEVLKQIDLRTKLIDPEKEFIVKFKNGILKDGRFIEIEYKEFTPYSIDIDYNPDAAFNEDVDKYVSHLTNNDKEYRDLLFEILGHTLITNKEVKRLLGRVFIFIGGGGNGKGTLLQIIKKILNTKNVTGLSIKEMTDERYMSSMKGKLANLGDDIQDGVIDDKMMKVLKNISTCDFVATRELYETSESISFTNSLIFTSNHLIKSFEKGDSWKRRVMWLPMYSTVSEKNKDNRFISKQTSKEALEYWVSLIVQGYMRLYENNKFTESALVVAENERYHQENNGLLLFLEDVPKESLIGKRYMKVYTDDYVPWVEENGGNVQSQKAFKEAVMEIYNLDVQPRKVDGKNQRVFVERKEDK